MLDKKEAIRVEIKWLLTVGFSKVYHPEWLANPVLVQKKRIKNGECALITLISTNTALKTPSVCLG